MRPSFAGNLPPSEKQRAQEMPDARCTRGPVCNGSEYAHTSIQGSGGNPTFPAQWLYGSTKRLRRTLPCLRHGHSRVHRVPPRACDDRETPLVSGRDQIDILLIWVWRQAEFLKISNFRIGPCSGCRKFATLPANIFSVTIAPHENP